MKRLLRLLPQPDRLDADLYAFGATLLLIGVIVIACVGFGP